MKRIIALTLCLVLCMGLCVNVFAANENNTKGVVFSVELDKPNLTVSDEDQTVRMTFTANKEFETCSVSYTASTDEFPVTALKGGANMPAATVNPVTKMLSWNSNDGNVVKMQEFGIVDVKIPANTPAGTYELGFSKLKLSENYGADIWESTATAYATLTIAPAPVAVSNITLNKNTLALTVGGSETLTATVYPENATNKDVTWSSDNENAATVDANGTVTAVGEGEAIITATTEDGKYTATCTVTVTAKPVPIEAIALRDAAVSVGGTIQLEPVFTPADTTQRDVVWTSSDRTIATVDANGRVRGVAEGKVTITVTSTADRSITASCTVTVTKNLSDDLVSIIGALGNSSLPFNDVTVRDYFYDAVKWAVDRGITSGTSRYTFSPDAPCTRAQVVTFLWRAAGCPQPTSKSNPFTDVRADDYFYTAVLWAVENGITNGTSAKTFSPDATVTRAQVVTFLWRANGQPAAGNSGFADVSADKYYATAVAWAVSQRITTGTGFGVFSPDAACTRAQIVTFLYRAN